MQRRSVAKRNENTERRKAMRELILDELTKPISEGSNVTKLEWLIAKAINNTKDDVSLQDLQRLQELLGEKEQTFNFNARKTSDEIKDFYKMMDE